MGGSARWLAGWLAGRLGGRVRAMDGWVRTVSCGNAVPAYVRVRVCGGGTRLHECISAAGRAEAGCAEISGEGVS